MPQALLIKISRTNADLLQQYIIVNKRGANEGALGSGVMWWRNICGIRKS